MNRSRAARGVTSGIDLRIHATFLIVLAWAALAAYRTSGTAAGAVRGVLYTLALFLSVVLHAVVSNNRLDGVLTLDNVGEFVMIDAALRPAAERNGR